MRYNFKYPRKNSGVYATSGDIGKLILMTLDKNSSLRTIHALEVVIIHSILNN